MVADNSNITDKWRSAGAIIDRAVTDEEVVLGSKRGGITAYNQQCYEK
jgi:hypothetical protein